MPDTLTNDAIAQLLIDARRTSYTLRPGGEKRVTMTLACVEMLCQEVLRLRAERDAAVAEAVRRERDKAVWMAQTWFAGSVNGEPLIAALRRGEP